MWEPMMARLFAEPRYKRKTSEPSGDVNMVNLNSENNN